MKHISQRHVNAIVWAIYELGNDSQYDGVVKHLKRTLKRLFAGVKFNSDKQCKSIGCIAYYPNGLVADEDTRNMYNRRDFVMDGYDAPAPPVSVSVSPAAPAAKPARAKRKYNAVLYVLKRNHPVIYRLYCIARKKKWSHSNMLRALKLKAMPTLDDMIQCIDTVRQVDAKTFEDGDVCDVLNTGLATCFVAMGAFTSNISTGMGRHDNTKKCIIIPTEQTFAVIDALISVNDDHIGEWYVCQKIINTCIVGPQIPQAPTYAEKRKNKWSESLAVAHGCFTGIQDPAFTAAFEAIGLVPSTGAEYVPPSAPANHPGIVSSEAASAAVEVEAEVM